MPCPRTPPPLEPNGWEKQTAGIEVGCTATEKALWLAVFGPRKMSDTVRNLMNREAMALAHIPAVAVLSSSRGRLSPEAKQKLYEWARRVAVRKPG